MHRSLYHIAQDISRLWPQMSPYAKPYWEAMMHLDKVTDFYYQESAKSIVNYFLSNAGTWRGEHAMRIKAELKEILKAA